MTARDPLPGPANTQHLGGFVSGGDPEGWYPELWQWAVKGLGVRSVLDVGCGEGDTLLFFQGLGCEVLGVDGSPEAAAASKLPGAHLLHDYTTGPLTPPGKFDLVWSCEFVEHVERRYVSNFLATFAASSRYIMLTHALPGQAGYHHVNLQRNGYWIDQMARIGFAFRYVLSRQARLAAGKGYFRRSGLVFESAADTISRSTLVTPQLLAAEWFVRRGVAFARRRGVKAALREAARLGA